MEQPCRIGTTVAERAFPQILKVSVRLETSLSKAGKSDALVDTVDYAAVVDSIRAICNSQEFTLVERVAEMIAEAALKNPLLHGIEVKIRKRVFSGIEAVGACIYRAKSS